MSDGLGKRLIKALLDEQNLAELTKHGVSRDDLLDDAKAAYDWIQDYLTKTGTWPTAKIVEENTSITLPTTVDPLKYITDTVRKRSLSRHLEKGMETAVDLIQKREPDKAIEALTDCVLTKSNLSNKEKEIRSFTQNVESRIKHYEDQNLTKTLLGMKTPWDRVDKILMGWVNGELVVIIAAQNIGKSWCACIIANSALTEGKKVLLVTMEMSAPRFERRLDALHLKMPFSKFRGASFDPTELASVKTGLTSMKALPGDILVVDKQIVKAVHDVTALVVQHKPDLVIIDGGYRFESRGRDKGHWESTVKIVGDLQYAAESTNVPWIVTTQYGDSSETGKPVKNGPKMRAWGVRYGKEWVINPDVALGLYADEDIRLMNQLEIHFLKIRDAGGEDRAPFRINWDLEKMDFSQVKGQELSEKIAQGAEVSF